MDLEMDAKALLLVSHIMDNAIATPCVIPQTPQKIEFEPKKSPAPLPRCAPESKGMSSDYLCQYINALWEDKTTHPQTVTVVKGGSVISETAFFPFKNDVWHISFSLCKSITGLGVGLLIDDGKLTLDTKLSDIFDSKDAKIVLPQTAKITVRNLLTMSTGVGFNEAGSVTESDWTRSYLESTTHFEPGTKFAYNSMNSYMLSAIVERVSGKHILDLLNERLFSKMGIVNAYWEKSPNGIEKGGMGMYLLPEDMAKLGMLYLQKGKWNGEQLISEYWTTEATKAQIKTSEAVGVYDYGYQVWVKENRNFFSFNGMFGQNVLVFPDKDLVIAITAGDNENFQKGAFFSISERFFGDAKLPECRLADRLSDKKLRDLSASCSKKPERRHSKWFKPFDLADIRDSIASIAGRQYSMDDKDCVSIGLLPLMIQALGNNYTNGIKSVSFDKAKNGNLLLTVEENDQTVSFEVGFDAAAYATIRYHDEPYYIGASGIFAVNEDDVLVLKVDVAFLEMPNTRTIKFYFNDDGTVYTKWSENPNQLYLFNSLKAVMEAAPDVRPLRKLSQHFADTYPARVIEQTFVREATGTLVEK